MNRHLPIPHGPPALDRRAESLLDLARVGAMRPAIDLVLALLAEGRTADGIIADVLAPVQREVGELWETNRWGVGDEHAATAVVDGALGAMSLQTVTTGPAPGRVLVACAEGEHHTLPARMGAELLRRGGWDVTFLGGSLPAEDLQRFAAVSTPDAVVVSCTVPLFLPGARRCFAALEEVGAHPFAAGTAFGGSALRAARVGARGLVSSPEDLAPLLDAGPADLTPSPSPEALALMLDSEAVVERCLAVMRHRASVGTRSPSWLAGPATNPMHVLQHLATALDLDDDAVFIDFTIWWRRLLAHRGVSHEAPDRFLEILADVLTVDGLHRAAGLCAVRPGRDRRPGS